MVATWNLLSRQLVAEKQFWCWTRLMAKRRSMPIAGSDFCPLVGQPVSSLFLPRDVPFRPLAVVPAAGAPLPAVEETVVYPDTAGMKVTSWLHHRRAGLRAGNSGTGPLPAALASSIASCTPSSTGLPHGASSPLSGRETATSTIRCPRIRRPGATERGQTARSNGKQNSNGMIRARKYHAYRAMPNRLRYSQ